MNNWAKIIFIHRVAFVAGTCMHVFNFTSMNPVS